MVPAWFVEKTCLSSLSCFATFVENQLSTYVWVCFTGTWRLCVHAKWRALASRKWPFTLVSLHKPHGPGCLELLYRGTFASKITTELCGAIFCLFYKANAAEAARSTSIPTLSVILLSAPKYTIKAVRASSSLQATLQRTKHVNSAVLFENVDMCGFKVTALELN